MMTAIEAIIVMKRSNSYRRGDSPAPADEARLAICPMTVESPVKITTPFPLPSLHNVPKNAKFLVSRGLSCVQTIDLYMSKLSPVKLELSTFMSYDKRILKSAGIRVPSSTMTISPGTNSVAYNFYC